MRGAIRPTPICSGARAWPAPAAALLLMLAVLVAPVSAQTTIADGAADGTATRLRAVAKVHPASSARLQGAGVLLEIEAGAVDSLTEIDVVPLAETELAVLDAGMTNVTSGNARGFRFGPHGQLFLKPLRLTIPYDAQLLPAGMTAADVRAFYYDEAEERWVALDHVSVDPVARVVVSLTDHFTDIIAATITIPTHPEVASFVPTFMKDMKAATPGEGIDIIQPPQPSALGEARLSFAIEVPPGRNNLQPALALQYQSGGGNGWLGVGWTLAAQDIEVETRWGVPRYGVLPDDGGAIAYRTRETESYVLNGQALTPVAHRGPFEARTGAERTFHARVEGGFARVVRHGDHPGNFWWEVTDRNGIRSIYGDPPGASGGPGTLRDDADNIFRWALREVRDPHGNAMSFTYDRVNDFGIPGGSVTGRQLYLSAINYTGRVTGGGYEPGVYTVRFVRDSDRALAPWTRRSDVQIDCRGGFKQVTAELLRQVRVELDGELIRQYDLGYEVGAFGKSRLVSLERRGAGGEPFPGSAHRFAYHDDVRDAAGAYTGGFEPEAAWTVPFDDINLCNDLGPVDVCPSVFAPNHDRASALGGAITHSLGGHVYVGVNCGLPTKQNSIGLKVGSNVSRTQTRSALMDVNGDNLPDKVFRSGSGFAYRANQSGPKGSPSFSAESRPLTDLGAIAIEDAISGSIGPEAYPGGGTIIANVSGTLTIGTAYATDANGDGFVDVVRDGKIHFSHLDASGEPVFETTSANTPLPLASGAVDGDGVIRDHEPLFQDLVDRHPLVDVFRRWLAPFDGFVRIQGGARLDAPAESEDGVRVSIQHNETVLWAAEIAAGDGQAHEPAGVERVQVTRGDRLYFRVQSVFEGSRDAVRWDPGIDYLEVSPVPDANGLDAHHYRASEDFVLLGRDARARMPHTGEVRVTGVFEKPDTTSDDVAVTVLRNGDELLRVTMPWDSTGQVTLDLPFSVAGDDTSTKDVDEADNVHVRLSVDSPIDARRIGWLPDSPPQLVYESAVGTTVLGPNGEALVRIFLPYDLDLYPESDRTTPQEAWQATSDGFLEVTTALSGDWSFRQSGTEDPVTDGEITFTVKREGKRLARRTVAVNQGHAGAVTIDSIEVKQGDRLFFDYSVRDPVARGTVATQIAYLAPATAPETELGVKRGALRDRELPRSAAVDVPSALHFNLDLGDVTSLGRGFFSQPYRGWGYGGVNGNPDRDSPERPDACTGPRVSPTHALNEADLVLEDSLAQVATGKTAVAMARTVERRAVYVFSPVHERLADGTLRASWRGPDEESWIQSEGVSPSRLGLDLVGVPCPGDVGGGSADARAIPRIGDSGNVGAGVGYIIAVTGSVGRSTGEVDFLDLNGDQFPDIVGNGRVQFTLPDGGLEARNRRIAEVSEVRYADNLAGSISLGGTVPVSNGGSRGTAGASTKSAPRGERVSNLMPSLGFSGDLGGGSSKVKSELLDINGDGLPDKVHHDGKVALNLGYSFAALETWPGLDGLDESKSVEFSLAAGLGFNDFVYGWAGGLSYSHSVSSTRRSLLDLNGDGLVDRVRDESGALWVAFGTGTGFGSEVRWQGAAVDPVARSVNATLGGGGFVTIPIPIFLCTPVTPLFLIINPGVTVGSGMARQETALLDVDGDGLADYVRSTRDDELIVARNRTGRTNLLQRVEGPLGGSFTLDYERLGNTPALPRSGWALARVERFDGVVDDGPSPLLTTFAYASPRYDRGEREFYGFGEITEEHRSAATPDRVERSILRHYRNDSFYSRGLITSESTRDAAGRPFRGAEFDYAFRDVASQAHAADLSSRIATIFPMLVRAESRVLEGAAGTTVASQRMLEYDAVGNVVRVEEPGDAGPEDDLEATITYASCPQNFVLTRPTGIVVRNRGVTLAERHAVVDCATGDVLQIRERLANGREALTDLTYDPSGMLQRVEGPANLRGERYTLRYEHDARLGAHVARIEDSFGLVSGATHDLRFGRPTSTTDANGNLVQYVYDAFGRLERVTGPYEQGTGQATITFEHHPDAAVPWARTRHLDTARGPADPIEHHSDVAVPWGRTRHLDTARGPADPIETILFADGLGRVLQTKVDGTVHTGPDTPAEDVMVVSGRTRFDFLGRPVEQYQPVTEPLGRGPEFNRTLDPLPPGRIEYDALDRPVLAIQPDQTRTSYEYALAPDLSGILRHETTVTDANGRQRRFYRDGGDALVAVREGAGAWTSFAYDALGRMVSVTDARGNRTRLEYDLLGRRTLLERPDAGSTRFEYDAASNLVALRTAQLEARGEAIRYDYEFTRLKAVHYPPRARDRDQDARIAGGSLDDDENPQSDDVTYVYGDPGAAENAAGRIVRITDAVGVEERAYGRLGEMVRQDRTLVCEADDDDNPRPRVFTTRYRHDTWGRMLEVVYPAGEVVTYEYDAGGLVRRAVGDDAGTRREYLRRLEYDLHRQQAFLELGNGARTRFHYRALDQRLERLQTESASGMFQNLRYTYDPVGNILSLANEVAIPPKPGIGGPSLQQFEYDELYRLTGATGVRPLAHDKRDEYTLALRYDAIHNVLEKRQTHDKVEPSGRRVPRKKTSYLAAYTYSASQPHAAIQAGDQRLTYDANGNQITSSEGEDDDDGRRITWDDENRIRSVQFEDDNDRVRYAYDAAGGRVLKRGPRGEIATINQFFTLRNGKLGTQHYYVGATRLASRLLTPPGEREDDDDDDEEERREREAAKLHFYHPDHLGSTQFVTDADGKVTRHMEYFPFGEVWVDESKGKKRTAVGFAGGELDEDTGLHHFGARDQDPRLGGFLSVDPSSAGSGEALAAANPAAFNVYSYAFNNPARLVNPAGLTPGWWSSLSETFALYHGVMGHSVAGARAPPEGSGAFAASDSPVRLEIASGTGDFVAGNGAGVVDLSPPPPPQFKSRPRSNAVVGPRPNLASPPVAAAGPSEATRSRSNAVVGDGPAANLDGPAPVVIGENMTGRVTPFAKSVGAETIVDWLAGREWSKQLNDEFIQQMKAEGREILDIGPDFSRRLQNKLNPPDKVYENIYEREHRVLGGYTKIRTLFVRKGEYEGGVPGFDRSGKPEGGAVGIPP